MHPSYFLVLPLLLSLVACDSALEYEENSDRYVHTLATSVTLKANQAVLSKRPFINLSDYEDATRGLIAQDESLITKDQDGHSVWDMTS